MNAPAFTARSTVVLRTIGRRALLALVATCFLVIVLIIGLRRVMGALAQPLSLTALLLTLIAALVAAGCLRGLLHSHWRDKRWLAFVPTALIALLVIALWLPKTGNAAALVLCTTLVLDLAMAPVTQSDRMHWILKRFGDTRQPGLAKLPIASPPKTRADQDLLPDDVTQRFARRRLANGAEQIDGTVRIHLDRGQRAGFVHVAFCPPLDPAARVTCRQREGPPARIKVAQVLPQGARIEVRFQDVPQHRTAVVLEYSACCEASALSEALPPAANPGIGQQAQDRK